ncbi:MAG: InlB B-repeat-containing protein [Christensenellales bacterium]|jgi:uncharacterized repeat protein (TIGR02543 family)
MVITDYEEGNVFNIYYHKDRSQWVTVTFANGENSAPFHRSFEVIKDYPLNGVGQPNIPLMEFVYPHRGYKINPSGAWSPNLEPTTQVSTETMFTLQVVVDEDVKFDYTVNYVHDNYPLYQSLHTAKTGTHHIGSLNLGSHPEIKGYKIKEGQQTSINIKATDPYYENTINILYEQDPTQWTTINFIGSPHAGFSGYSSPRSVIKDYPLGGINQPNLYVPEITPHRGYKINPAGAWLPNYTADTEVSEETVFAANVIIDTSYREFKGTIKCQIDGHETPIYEDIVKGYIGEELSVSPYPLPGYKVKGTPPSKITILEDESSAETVLYEKDTNEWVNITFTAGANATVAEKQIEVVKDCLFNEITQPEIIPPTINPHDGYKINPDGAWSPNFALNIQVAKAQIFTSQVIVDTNQTFNYTINYYLEGTSTSIHAPKTGKTYIQAAFDVTSYLTLVGYQRESSTTTMTITADTTTNVLDVYYTKFDADWRDVTITRKGQSLTGEYTEVLETEVINEAITNIIELPKTLTGFTYDTSNPLTYEVTSDATQEITVTYSRNKYTISFNSNGGNVTPSPITDVYYDAEINLFLDNTPTRTGYTLANWTYDDTATIYQAGDKMPGRNITLKANWDANVYRVVFYKNDGSSDETYQNITYDVETQLDGNPFAISDFYFMGWATSPTGSVTYQNQAPVINLAVSGDFYLYAVWVGAPVTLNLNGGTLPTGYGYSETMRINLADLPYVLPWPTKTLENSDLDFEFLGWYTTNNTSGTKYDVIDNPSAYTLYAIWGPYSYNTYYMGIYPQTKVTNTALINALNELTPEESEQYLETCRGVRSHTETWKTVFYSNHKFEKVGDDYFKYEPILFQIFADGTLYSKQIIDYSPFDYPGASYTNDFSASYMEKYLNQVLKVKAEMSSTLGLFSVAELENIFPDIPSRDTTMTDYAVAIRRGARSYISWAYYPPDYADPDNPNCSRYWTRTAESSGDYNQVKCSAHDGIYSVWNQYVYGVRCILPP